MAVPTAPLGVPVLKSAEPKLVLNVYNDLVGSGRVELEVMVMCHIIRYGVLKLVLMSSLWISADLSLFQKNHDNPDKRGT